MESQDYLPLHEIIIDFIKLFFRRIKDIFTLFGLEAQLAKKSLVRILILVFFLGCLMISIWLSLLASVFFFMISLHYSWLISSLVILGLNSTLVLAVTLIILKSYKNLLFTSTRKQLHTAIINRDNSHEQPQAKD